MFFDCLSFLLFPSFSCRSSCDLYILCCWWLIYMSVTDCAGLSFAVFFKYFKLKTFYTMCWSLSDPENGFMSGKSRANFSPSRCGNKASEVKRSKVKAAASWQHWLERLKITYKTSAKRRWETRAEVKVEWIFLWQQITLGWYKVWWHF